MLKRPGFREKIIILTVLVALVGCTIVMADARIEIMKNITGIITKNAPGQHDQAEHGAWSDDTVNNSPIPDSNLLLRRNDSHSPTSSPQTTSKPQRITPNPRPTPRPLSNNELAKKLPSSVPKFSSQQAESKWLKENNLGKIQLGNINSSIRPNVIEAYIKMGKNYPDVVLNNSINTFDSRAFPLNVIDKVIGNGQIDNTFGFAISAYVPNTGILLNERYFSNLSDFNKSYKDTIESGWHPTVLEGYEVEIIVAHELSHAIYTSMPDKKKKKWNDMLNNPAMAAFFLGGSSNTPGVPGLSDYSKSDPSEAFSEALSSYYYGNSKYKRNPLVLTAYAISKEE